MAGDVHATRGSAATRTDVPVRRSPARHRDLATRPARADLGHAARRVVQATNGTRSRTPSAPRPRRSSTARSRARRDRRAAASTGTDSARVSSSSPTRAAGTASARSRSPTCGTAATPTAPPAPRSTGATAAAYALGRPTRAHDRADPPRHRPRRAPPSPTRASSARSPRPDAPLAATPPTISGSRTTGRYADRRPRALVDAPDGYAYAWLRCNLTGPHLRADRAGAVDLLPTHSRAADAGHTLIAASTRPPGAVAGRAERRQPADRLSRRRRRRAVIVARCPLARLPAAPRFALAAVCGVLLPDLPRQHDRQRRARQHADVAAQAASRACSGSSTATCSRSPG